MGKSILLEAQARILLEFYPLHLRPISGLDQSSVNVLYLSISNARCGKKDKQRGRQTDRENGLVSARDWKFSDLWQLN